jgi:hypothetical protein
MLGFQSAIVVSSCVDCESSKLEMALALTNSIVKWSPFTSSFIAYDSKLKLYDVIITKEKGRTSSLSQSFSVTGDVTTLDWYQHPSTSNALAFGTASASVYFLDWSRGEPEYTLLRQPRKSRQQCTEVTWNKFNPSQVACAFDKSKK